MIQRIQTVYLAIAAIIAIVCLFFPVGTFVPEGVEPTAVMSNLAILSGTNEHEFDFRVIGLFLILLLTAAINTGAIFMFSNRKKQAKFCVYAIVLLLLWYAYYGACAFLLAGDYNASFHIQMNAAFPLVSLILTWLARHAILADEALVRAADRIR